MNVSIVYKSNVNSVILDDLARELPVILSEVLDPPAGSGLLYCFKSCKTTPWLANNAYTSPALSTT